MKSMLKSLMSVAVAALAFTSCSNDATEEIIAKGELKTLEVNATIDQTRTTLDGNHAKLQWADGDQINLYIGTNTTGHSTDPNGGTIKDVTYNPGDKVYAYYSLPESGKSSSGAGSVLINIVQEQKQPAVNVFEGKNMPMVAVGDIVDGKVELAFQPIGCVLVFNVYGQGKNEGEKIKSIKFETSTGCYGYDYLDLTEGTKYEAYNNAKEKFVTVSLPEGAYAPIVAAKPAENTHFGSGNQVYLVVAPVDYPAGSKFTVTTDAAENNTYTFTTTTALECSQKTARVVNLNLAKSAEIKPAIEVPDVPEQKSEGGDLTIQNIVLKNITASDATVGIYSDKELTAELTESWLTLTNITTLASGELYCTVAPNETTESRTVYIGIKCGDVQAAIAITQVGAGSTPAVSSVAKYIPEKMGYTSGTAVPGLDLDGGSVHLAFAKKSGTSNPPKYYSTEDSALRCYAGNTITVSSKFKITKIAITRGAQDPNSNNWLVDNIELSGDTWTGESNTVVLTVSGTKGQTRIETMEITYSGKPSEGGDQPGGGEQPDPVQPDPDPTTPPTPGTILFEKDFNTLTGTDAWNDYDPSTFSDATQLYKHNNAIRIGSKNNTGSITTPELNLLAPVTLEFKVKGYNENEAGNIDISVSNGTAAPITKKVSFSAGTDFQSVSVSFDAATSTSTITIATTSDGSKRAIIDDIIVKVTEQ